MADFVDNPLNPTGTPDWIWEQEHPDNGGGEAVTHNAEAVTHDAEPVTYTG